MNIHFNDDCANPGDDTQHATGERDKNNDPVDDLALAESIETRREFNG